MSIMKTSTSFRSVPMAMDACQDAGQALVKAGLNYRIDSKPLSHITPFDMPYADKFYAAVRSTDQAVLGVNSARFHHFQPEMLGTIADALIKVRPDAYISGGGQSKDERTQFLIVTLDGEPVVGPQGTHNRNVMLINGTNGNAMLQAVAFDFMFSCMNQFPHLRRTGESLFKLGHTWSSSQAIPTAIKAVQDAARHFDDLDREIEVLLNTPLLSPPKRLFEEIAGPRPDKDGRGLTLWEDRVDSLWAEFYAPHNANIVDTGFGVVMAAQAVDEHGSKVRKGERDLQRVGRVISGSYPLMERALTLV